MGGWQASLGGVRAWPSWVIMPGKVETRGRRACGIEGKGLGDFGDEMGWVVASPSGRTRGSKRLGWMGESCMGTLTHVCTIVHPCAHTLTHPCTDALSDLLCLYLLQSIGISEFGSCRQSWDVDPGWGSCSWPLGSISGGPPEPMQVPTYPLPPPQLPQRHGQTRDGKSECRHSRNQQTKMDWNG